MAMGDGSMAAKSVRVMHFADVHLGVENYGKFNPETGLNSRLEDFTGSLHAAIDRALDAEADIALFAGDAYKARDPNQTHQRAFAGALRRLTDAGVPVALLIGNHDVPNTRGRAHALEIFGLLSGPGVTIFSSPKVATITTRKGYVLVAGMPYLTRSRVLSGVDDHKGKSVEEIARLIAERYGQYVGELASQCAESPETIALLMGHFTVTGATVGVQQMLLNPSEPQVPVSQLALPQFDYVALGHIHKHQELNAGHQPPVLYCGSIDRLDFGERSDDKGFVLADVEKKRAQWKFLSVPTRRFLEIKLDATDSDDPTEFLLAELEKYPLDGSVVRLSYRVRAENAPHVRTEELRKALAPASFLVALQRDQSDSESRILRSRAIAESPTPEQALVAYLNDQPRLAPRKDDLLAAARHLFDQLADEEANG